MTPEYNVVADEIEFVAGPYLGIKYKYGAVKLIPNYEEDRLTLSFNYEILSEIRPSYADRFEQKIGEILTELIGNQLQTNSIVYSGGV